MRVKPECQRSASDIPYAEAVAGLNTEVVVARVNVVVTRGAMRASIDPIDINTFEFVFETIAFRRLKTQRGEMKLKLAAAGRQFERIVQQDGIAIIHEILDHNWR